jgi:CAAX prenyl protease-like protein
VRGKEKAHSEGVVRATEKAHSEGVMRATGKVGFPQFPWVALVVSSTAFGLMHGSRWLAGTAAGAIYAFAFLRRNRLGDAIAAHATTNALLAAWVLLGDNWKFW